MRACSLVAEWPILQDTQASAIVCEHRRFVASGAAGTALGSSGAGAHRRPGTHPAALSILCTQHDIWHRMLPSAAWILHGAQQTRQTLVIRLLGSTSNAVPSSNWLQMFRPCVRVGSGYRGRTTCATTRTKDSALQCSRMPGIGSVHAGAA